jgi:SAM-dependent methyltransferase
MVRYADSYLDLRNDPNHVLGYGLMRRTRQLIKHCRPYVQSHPGTIQVVDFGCADGHMLTQIAGAFADRRFRLIGLDRFPKGVPPTPGDLDMKLMAADLFAREPLPLPAGETDIIIASAFVKHHPRVGDLLKEAHRLLKPAGILVMIDPRPWVVHVGRMLKHFSRQFTPSIWGERSIRALMREQLPGAYRVQSFERYWIAPKNRFYVPSIEDNVPGFVRALTCLHQSMVLEKTEPAKRDRAA